MMADTKKLVELLQKLSGSLERSDKSDTAKYFSDKARGIGSVSSDKELKEICQELSSSGSISQYANFSYEEDKLFDLIYQCVNEIISS